MLDCLNGHGVTHWTREAAYEWLMELMQFYMISLESQLEGFYENDTAHEAKMATKNVRQEYMDCGKIEPRKKRT